MTRILLVGRSHWVIDAVRDKLQTADLQVDGALDAPDATDVLRRAHVDHVFIGPGLDVDTRLEVVRTVITGSDTTTVHLKDQSTGPEGALRWVRAVLLALDEMQDVDGGHGRCRSCAPVRSCSTWACDGGRTLGVTGRCDDGGEAARACSSAGPRWHALRDGQLG